MPAGGIIRPDHFTDVVVHHEEFHTLEEFVDGIPQNWWCEDTRDKEVILVVNVRGSRTIETATHHIRLHHCFSSKTVRVDSKSSSSSRSSSSQGGSLHRSEFRHCNSSSDVADDIWMIVYHLETTFLAVNFGEKNKNLRGDYTRRPYHPFPLPAHSCISTIDVNTSGAEPHFP